MNRLDARTQAALSAAAASLALGVSLATAIAVPRPAYADPDSLGSVQRVQVDEDGVTIERSSGHRRSHHFKADMEVDGKHVRIGDGDRSVSVDVVPRVHIDSDEGQIVRMFSNIVVDSTEEVTGDVVAIFGTVTVRGRVDGDAVAVMGSVRLTPGAVVDGDAVAIGGGLEQPSGAVVRGESVSLTFLPMLPGVPPLRAICLVLLVLWLLAMLLGSVLALLLPKGMAGVARTLSERTGWSVLIGLALPPLNVIAAMLLLVTLIGIPLAILLPIVYLVMLWVGAVAAAYLLGCRLSRREVGEGGWIGPVLLGSLPVALMFGLGALLDTSRAGLGSVTLLFGLLGLLLATLLCVIGSGAVLLAMMSVRSSRAATSAAPPVAPAAGSGPSPPDLAGAPT